jgi:hypothetical protein
MSNRSNDKILFTICLIVYLTFLAAVIIYSLNKH